MNPTAGASFRAIIAQARECCQKTTESRALAEAGRAGAIRMRQRRRECGAVPSLRTAARRESSAGPRLNSAEWAMRRHCAASTSSWPAISATRQIDVIGWLVEFVEQRLQGCRSAANQCQQLVFSFQRPAQRKIFRCGFTEIRISLKLLQCVVALRTADSCRVAPALARS